MTAIKFETIGNATLIVYENNSPLIASDAWFDTEQAYFGSWRLSHKVPIKQRESIEKAKYIFISHFHPDHLNVPSLRHCKKSTIIIAQHYGNRVEKDLRNIGFNVLALPSRKWISIGKRTRIMLFNNEGQDSAMLIELTDDGGEKSLLLNLNDSGGFGFEKEVALISKKYKNSFYLQLHGWGDSDMINLFNEKGTRIEPLAAKKFPVGRDIKSGLKKFNANIAIPFSCFHQYQRRDSYWANKYATPAQMMSEGFIEEEDYILLPAFQVVELKKGTFISRNINPEKLEIIEPVHESEFGDDWDECLSEKEIKACIDYFQSITTLFKNYKSIILSVGGTDHEMLHKTNGSAILRFSVPRTSLLKAVRREIFDDLLIGNFMKTQIKVGRTLYDPDFNYTVTKYSDNGRAKDTNELHKYFKYYNHNRKKRDIFAKFYMENRRTLLGFLGNNLRTRVKYLMRK